MIITMTMIVAIVAGRAAAVPRPAQELGGNHLSNATCLTQVFFKSDE